MSEEFRLKIKRDNMGRIISRITEDKGECWTVSFSYNDKGDLNKTIYMENSVVTNRQEYRYEYDWYGNKTAKIITMIDLKRETKTESVFIYKNDYNDNKLMKKVCLFDGVKLYENLYHYIGDKIERIERFNGRESFALWRVEFLDYQDGTIRNTVYLANNVLSHYAVCNMSGGEIISKQIINPMNGEYCWHIASLCDDYCSIYVGEDSLSSYVLSEILCYASSLKKPTIKYFLVIVECSDTFVDTSDKSLQNIENAYRERGIITEYSP